MRLSIRTILLVIVLVLVGSRRMYSGDQYDPLPLPDIPFPNDPPFPFDDPFDPINDLPDPFDLPFPPEDDLPPLPDPWDIPPPDIPDPFTLDEPSLFPDPFDDLPDPFDDFPPPPLPPFPPQAVPQTRALAVTNPVSKLMPFPMRIPFHPAYSGKSAPQTKPQCNAASASQLIIPESNKNRVAFFGTCPPQRTATVTVGNTPVKAAPTPDGTQVLVANAGDGTVSVLNIASKAVTKTITLTAPDGSPVAPNNIAFLPDGSRAYVTDHACNSNPESTMFIIDMASLTVSGTFPISCFPSGLAVSPDGTQVWVASRGDSRVDVYDTATNARVFGFNVPLATGIAFNPSGSTVYLAEGNSPGFIQVIDASSYQLITRIAVGNLPHVLKVSPSGHDLFVTNGLSNNISQISTLTNTVTRTLPLPSGAQHPLGLAFIH